MRQYPMTLSTGVKLVTGLVVLLLCATPVVVWSLSSGILGPSRSRAGNSASCGAPGARLPTRSPAWTV